VASYRVVIKRAAAKELEDVAGKKDRQRIVARILGLSDDPRPPGVEKLSGSSEKYRIRQGSCRVIFEIEDDAALITIVKIGHRKDVYRK
jgi:mRNA interferase RelE/StbE